MDYGKIIFTAEGSVRYHQSRAEHFNLRARWLTISGMFLGGSVFLAAVASYPLVTSIAGLLVAMSSTYRLVAKPDEFARQHEKWCQEWSNLRGDVQANPTPTKAMLTKWIKRLNKLNGECLEDMKAVKATVYNETLGALGRKGGVPYRISRFQRWTKHFLRHTHSFDAQNNPPQPATTP